MLLQVWTSAKGTIYNVNSQYPETEGFLVAADPNKREFASFWKRIIYRFAFWLLKKVNK